MPSPRPLARLAVVAAACAALMLPTSGALAAPPGHVVADTTAATSSDAERVNGLVAEVDAARAALAGGDVAGASAAVAAFHRDWRPTEGFVKARSPSAYTATEDDMDEAAALLKAQPARVSEADSVLARMRDRLAPLAETTRGYGVGDAFIIMLREGLEALLVIGALVAFLRRSGNGHRQGWVWGGAGVGLALSLGLALLLQQGFGRAEAALGSEVVEGVVGLTAAVMLFYVSYWLHTKSRLGAWQAYIRQRSSAALAGGSMVSLALVAGLAIFREGAETAVFYVGIAPSIAFGDLALGLALGLACLAAVGVAVLVVGVRLPLRPFFLASSALIYYLGFKFVGTGLHALQMAGLLPATPAPVPASDTLGLYPTWETAIPQLALVGLALVVVWLSLRSRAPSTRTPSAAGSA